MGSILALGGSHLIEGFGGAFLLAALVAVVMTAILIRLAPRLGLLDRPHSLGIHRTAVPRVGGLAIFVAFLMAVGWAWASGIPLDSTQAAQLLGMVMGVAILVAAGLLDDLRRIAPEVKFSWELLGAIVAIIYGVQAGLVPALLVAAPLTALYLVGGANALNLLDGMDGLAAGVSAISAIFLGIMGFLAGDLLVVFLSCAVLGALLGFLPYNLNPAKTFMGDCGSLQLGFLLAGAAALLSSQPYNWVLFVAPLAVLGIPLLDTAGALVRRKRARVDMFSGDRRHIYDLVPNMGLGYRTTVSVLWAASAGLGLAGLWATTLGGISAMALLGFIPVAALGVGLRLGLFSNGEPQRAQSVKPGATSRFSSEPASGSTEWQEARP